MTARLYNRTRKSASIPRTLLRRGRVVELPLYYVLRLSDLAREGIDYSGSHRFADHIYRNEPSGRAIVGRWLDAGLLAMPAVRSFRARYLAARVEVERVIRDRLGRGGRSPIRVLSVPCGIPRELADAADEIRRAYGEVDERVEFHGIDLDPAVLQDACAFASARGLHRFYAHHADALSPSAYSGGFVCITSTGLAEFLDDGELRRFYEVCLGALEPGGVFVTSGMRRQRFADYLLRLAEIQTHYRGPEDMVRIAQQLPFSRIDVRTDAGGLQTILTAAV